jgi:uncharacterized protein (TIGR02246 family)
MARGFQPHLPILHLSRCFSGVPKIVAKRYAKDAVLLPSSNGDPILNLDGIEAFYSEYLKQKPQKRVLEGSIRFGFDWAEDVGVCEICLRDPVSGTVRKIKARYSFFYVWESHQWKILHHHSSILGAVEAKPAAIPSVLAGPMNTERVQNLFQFLQDAINTGDSDAVARRFTDDGLLLPLEVYESPKRGYHEIYNYMDEFLIGRPKMSKVDRIQVSVDPALPGLQTWAKDVGVLELTFKKDGSKLNARYSLDYVLDKDGVWKVSQFHITPLPQDWAQLRQKWTPSMVGRGAETSTTPSIGTEIDNTKHLPPKVTEDQVRGWFIEWNNAMATGDPKVVMNRYAKDAIMMTTMSQQPKTTAREISQFYRIFLWNRPQARQLESYVTLSSHWAKDVGVLEYSFSKSDGQLQKVRERYSFLYTFDEAAGWRIAHHHASVIPNGLAARSGAIHESSDNSQPFQ